jgi:hypothetical protein
MHLSTFYFHAVVQQARELEALRQQRDKHMNEMKNMDQGKGTTIQNDFEKKVIKSVKTNLTSTKTHQQHNACKYVNDLVNHLS